MKKKKRNNKKSNSIGNIFAYGGTAMKIETPQEAVARNRKANIEATYEGMSNKLANVLGDIGGFLTSTGLNLVTSGVSQAGGFGKVLGSNDKLSGFGKGLDSILGIKTGEAGIGKIDKVLPGAEVERIDSDLPKINYRNDSTLPDLLPNSFGGGKGFGKPELSKWLEDNYGLFINAPFSPPNFAMGGTVGNIPIEAEGGEIIETPGGIPQELVGPSHEGGGMDMLVPPGTDIYSKRVKGPDGRSMAQRKKDREKKEAKLKKLLEKNKGDKTLQRTLDKVIQDNEIEDAQDMEYMRTLQSQQQFAFGGTVPPTTIEELDENGAPIPELVIIKKKKQIPQFIPRNLNINSNIPNIPTIYTPPIEEEGENKSFWETLKGIKHPLKGVTTGDIIGMYSNWKAGRDQMQNTINQFKNTPNEENHYKNYGKEALGTIRDQYGVLEGIKDDALQDLQLSRTAQINNNSNSARGINTLRALNMATDAQMDKGIRDVYNNMATQKMAIMEKEAAQLDEIDAKVMEGEKERAKNQLENQDAFFTQMGQNIADKYKGYSNIAKQLNARKEFQLKEGTLLAANPFITKDPVTGEYRTDYEKMKQQADYERQIREESNINPHKFKNANDGSGIEYEYDKQGKPKKSTIESLEKEENSYIWKGVINPRTGKEFSSAEEFAIDQRERKMNPYIDQNFPIKYTHDHTQYIDPISKKAFESQGKLNQYLRAGGDINKLEKVVANNTTSDSYIINPETNLPLLKGKLSESQSKDLEEVLKKLDFKVDLNDSNSIKELQKKLGMPKKYQTGRLGNITLKYISQYNG